MAIKVIGITCKSDSGRLYTERIDLNPPTAKPFMRNTSSFVINLFKAWKKLHQMKKAQRLTHTMIGILFYEAMTEFFDPKHRNAFLEMLEKEKR